MVKLSLALCFAAVGLATARVSSVLPRQDITSCILCVQLAQVVEQLQLKGDSDAALKAAIEAQLESTCILNPFLDKLCNSRARQVVPAVLKKVFEEGGSPLEACTELGAAFSRADSAAPRLRATGRWRRMQVSEARHGRRTWAGVQAAIKKKLKKAAISNQPELGRSGAPVALNNEDGP
ncbi:hypothetical protein GGX14DRAFT_403784 [Mycena pura]|uniref:Saposin B-type domain-containing protein n=1 Tax=Mycena pura TaxID=153505 RepID=A0AAD6UZP5_9AGAR|nr:hypothetical protein GGX14DRAFT_403784 [Mycena pura]